MDLMKKVDSVLDRIRDEYAPDPRISVFDVEVYEDGPVLSVVVVTSDPAAAEAVQGHLGDLETGELKISVIRLPVDNGGRSHALITSAIAPMLAYPTVSAAHVSQALMGHRLMVLRRLGRWLQCRAQDGYLGWIHQGYLELVDETQARAWEIGNRGEVCLSLGASLEVQDAPVARLPWGARVLREKDGGITLPGGISGQAVGDLLPMTQQKERFPPRGASLVETATRWIGSPYLWGGTTPAGVDCSGLVQALYRTHGLDLPRDSDQQADAGDPVDPGVDFTALMPGDLLFFAEEPGRITHVALSTGGPEIIHSSLGNGGVWRNNVAGSLEYEREMRQLFVCARRFLPESGQ